MVDPYLHSLIPPLCQFLTRENRSGNFQLQLEIVLLIKQFSVKCPSTIQYISHIIQSLLRLIAQHPAQDNLVSQIMNCFVTFTIKYKNDFQVPVKRRCT